MSTCTVNVVRIAHNLVSNNNPPSSLEAVSVRGAIANEDKLIVELKAQVKEAKSRVRQYQAVLSPCRRLPPDILGEIFLRIPLRKSWHDASYYQDVVRRLVLVCRRWRDAALATPRLWSTLEIIVKKSPLKVDALTTWLCRSGNLPKDLDIRSSTCIVPKDPRTAQKKVGWRKNVRPCFNGNALCVLATSNLAEALCRMTGQCNSVYLACDSPGCAQNFARLLSHALRLPESSGGRSAWHSSNSFTLVGRDWNGWPASPHFLSHLVPNSVTDLELHLSHTFGDTSVKHKSVELKIPPALLERLISLTLSPSICGRHLYPLLQQCRNLERLILDHGDGCFEESYGPHYDRASQSGVVMPKLQFLSIQNTLNVTGLEVLRMPALVELSIMFSDVDEAYFDDSRGLDCQFGTFVAGHLESNLTLRSLTIQGGNFAANTLFNVLRKLTALTNLTLDRSYYPRNLFLKLSVPIPCLSNLRYLRLLDLSRNVERFLHLSEFVGERGIALETSRYDGEVWGSDSDSSG